MTAPSQVDYHDVLRVWREADTIPEIEHAWLFDHLMPIGGDPSGPTHEGWTMLSALAAQTRRLRLGLLVTSNRFRPPAMLAKIAATVDIVSGGRLDFGIGAGSRPCPPILIGGRSAPVLRVVAEHADLWNIPGGDIDDAIRRSALLDRYCAEIGRDPASVTRSIHLLVSYDQPSMTLDAIGEAIDAGFQHIVLGLPDPYPGNVAQWVTDELITPSA
ncbi:LLM class flavin-dependent oxidoreductase [Actinomadura sp. 3N407]|uniref:LLM class flavin-dependent oxidoreductase n=1 Tax=Actinomadura sp. 3N407 TaxID=3457423 RepID=UPI003FCCAA66